MIVKNYLLIFLGIANCGSMIGSEGPRTRSMARQWRTERDAILAQRQPWSLDKFNDEERERLYQLNKGILAQNSLITKENAEVLSHGSFSSWILGALCLGISFYKENSSIIPVESIAQCAGCSCMALGVVAGVMACKECRRARQEARELAEMQSKEI
jgi:hypothetical protein